MGHFVDFTVTVLDEPSFIGKDHVHDVGRALIVFTFGN
jgi:hypothetical protein